MKIENTQLNTPSVASGDLHTNVRNYGAPSKVEKSTVEQVSISSKFLELKSLGLDIAKVDAFDAQKVAAIKTAISEGGFRVDASLG